MQRKNFLITFLGTHLSTLIFSAQMFLVTPYLLKKINLVTYAAWTSINEIVVFFSFLDFGVSMNTLNNMSYSFINKDTDNLYKYFWVNFWVIILAIPVLFISIFFILNLYMQKFNIPVAELFQFKITFYMAALASYLVCLTGPCVNLLLCVQETKLLTFSSILSTIIGAIACVILLLNDQKLYCVGFAYLIRALMSMIGNYFCVYIYINHKSNTKNIFYKHYYPDMLFIKKICRTSISSLIVSLSNNLLTRIDNILLTWFAAPKIMVCYSISKRLLDLLKPLVDSYIYAIIGPYTNRYHSLEKYEVKPIIIKVIVNFCFLIYICSSLYLLLNKKFIFLWVKDNSFFIDHKIVLLITFNVYISSLSTLVIRLIFSSNFQDQSCRNMLLETGFKIVIGIASLAIFGIIGMSISFIIIGIYIVQKNIKFIDHHILNKINGCFFNKTIINNLLFFLSIICINSILFFIFEKYIVYSFIVLFFQIGLLIWYHPHLSIKKMVWNTGGNV